MLGVSEQGYYRFLRRPGRGEKDRQFLEQIYECLREDEENGENYGVRRIIACKGAIENAIAENYRDNRLGGDAVPQVIEQFGYTRTLYVMANTVQQKDWDGRFSPANKAWAKTVDIPPNPDGFGGNRNLDFVVDSHPAVLNGFIDLVREEQRSRIQAEKAQLSKTSVREKLKQEPPARKPAVPKKREPER